MGPTASIHLDSGRGFGAAQRRVLYLLQGLAAHGHRVVLACPRSAQLHERARAAGIPTTALTLRSELDFPSAVRLARLVRDESCDLVHAHDPQSHSIARAAQGINRERSLLVNLFVTHHEVPEESSAAARLEHSGTAVHHIASSRQIRDALVRRGVDPERIAVVPNGVDLESLRGSRDGGRPDPWGLGARGLQVVGSVGPLTRDRNHVLMLQAFARLRDTIPDAHLLLVGDGPLRASLEKRARNLGLTDSVTFARTVNDSATVFATLRIFVLSSDVEGPCSAILDAMAAGTPVVTTAAAGILGMARHGTSALVVPPRDTEALAQAMTLVLQQPDLEARLVQGGREVAEQHSVERMVEATLAAYRSLGQFAAADQDTGR